jgi:hypothetical protein
MGRQDELKAINNFIEEAAEYGLEAELIYTALLYMREDSSLSPSQAMKLGAEEWIK